MDIQYADFIGSFPQYTLAPRDEKPEYAFIGRSNVGKSSLINMLLDKKGIAHISSKPGKTQSLNYYMINGTWYVVDLPGYGYAKISKTQRQKWERMIQSYLKNRPSLVCTFILIDGNIKPQEKDLEFINWLGDIRIPFSIVYTKADKSRKFEQVQANIAAFQTEMLKTWSAMPNEFITSAKTKRGRNEVLQFIADLNKDYIEFHENL